MVIDCRNIFFVVDCCKAFAFWIAAVSAVVTQEAVFSNLVLPIQESVDNGMYRRHNVRVDT